MLLHGFMANFQLTRLILTIVKIIAQDITKGSKLLDKNAECYKEYKTKYEECITKAMMFYEHDKDFAKLFQEHKQQKKKQIILIVISIVAALLVIAGIIYWCIMYK